MVPQHKPEAALTMFSNFISQSEFKPYTGSRQNSVNLLLVPDSSSAAGDAPSDSTSPQHKPSSSSETEVRHADIFPIYMLIRNARRQ